MCTREICTKKKIHLALETVYIVSAAGTRHGETGGVIAKMLSVIIIYGIAGIRGG